MKIAHSVNNTPIRLPLERWQHIRKNHPELANKKKQILSTVANPDIIFTGDNQELLAAKQYKNWLVVVYKENKQDGFIITAFLTSRINYLLKKEITWQKPSLNK